MTFPAPTVLCILDGWGDNPSREANAPALAATPTFDTLRASCPSAQLITHGPDAGLPTGQMGNSEVGHTNIGAGRVVAMDLGEIDLTIEDGSFFENEQILAFAEALQKSGGAAHLMGVASDGGVHGHLNHIVAAATLLCARGVPVEIHALTDGRDVGPKTADAFVTQLSERLPSGARVVTVIGRYYAMDRDNRWERVAKAFHAMVNAQGKSAETAADAVAQSYADGVTDEFILPTVVGNYGGISENDGLFCLNFRADRAREILAALCAPSFGKFDISSRPVLAARLGMVEYSEAHNAYMPAAFPKRDIVNTLGEWVAKHGCTQFRLAETEKYPHVTFFLNGGREAPYIGEDRFMPSSPKVATYDLAPQMAAAEVTEALVEAIAKDYDLTVVNFANPDMVGHTGDLEAAIKACEAVDRGLAKMLAALKAKGGALLLTADHGNCEVMVDPETGGPHTAHTTNPVPVILFGGPTGATLRNGRLADLAPTLLALMGLPQPPEMTGESLIVAP